MARFVGIAALVLLMIALMITSVYAEKGMKPSSSIEPGLQGISKHPLTAAQQNQIKAIRQENQRKVQSIMSNPKLTQQEKAKQIAAARTETHNKVMNVLTPDQKKEVSDWQRSHPRAAGKGKGMAVKTPRPLASGSEMPMLKKYPLTKDQKERIADLRKDEQKEIQSVNVDKKLTSQQKAERIREIRSRTNSDINSLLTTEQKNEIKSNVKSRRKAPVK